MIGESKAYVYNNEKLAQINETRRKKELIAKKQTLISNQVTEWNKKVLDMEAKALKSPEKGISDLLKIEETKTKKESDVKEEEVEESAFDDPDMFGKSSPDSKYQSSDQKADDNSGLESLNEFERATILSEEKLSAFMRFIIYVERRFTEQILFESDRHKVRAFKVKAERGETKILTYYEKILLKDYNRERNVRVTMHYDLPEDIPDGVKDYFLNKEKKWGRLTLRTLSTIFELFISNTALICYIMMILCVIYNGSLVSIVYPFSMFAYAILEEARPTQGYWKFIIYYSVIIMSLKFLLQTFPLSSELANNEGESAHDDSRKSANDSLRSLRIGIEVVENGKSMIGYFAFEGLIVFFTIIHIYKLIFAGIWDVRETEIETLQMSVYRISNQKSKIKRIKIREQEEKVEPLLTKKLPKRSYSDMDLFKLGEIRDELAEKFKRLNVLERLFYEIPPQPSGEVKPNFFRRNSSVHSLSAADQHHLEVNSIDKFAQERALTEYINSEPDLQELKDF